MVVRFSAIRIKNDNIETRRNYHLCIDIDKEVQVKFHTTLLFKLILISLTRLSRILHGFYSFEDDDKSVFTNLWIQPVLIIFSISNTGGGKPKGNSSAAETSRVQGM